MAKDKLNISEVLEFKVPFWKQLAQSIKKWIWADMLKGEVQSYIGGRAKYYSAQYKKYKTNEMKRFTDGKRLGSPRQLKDGTVKNYKNNALIGKNTNTSSTPNMLLTGETIKGLDYLSSDSRNMIMSYKEKDAGKIKGNEDLGRDIRTLNEANMTKLKAAFEKEIDKNIRNWCKKTLIITVGKQ